MMVTLVAENQNAIETRPSNPGENETSPLILPSILSTTMDIQLVLRAL